VVLLQRVPLGNERKCEKSEASRSRTGLYRLGYKCAAPLRQVPRPSLCSDVTSAGSRTPRATSDCPKRSYNKQPSEQFSCKNLQAL
jgi:hypothetical protein